MLQNNNYCAKNQVKYYHLIKWTISHYMSARSMTPAIYIVSAGGAMNLNVIIKLEPV